MKQYDGSSLEAKRHVKLMMKQGNETESKTSNETCSGKNEKRPWSTCYICGTS
jgi:hypothetical protein